MSSNSMTPNQREGLTAQSTVTSLNEYLKSTNGALNVTTAGSGTGDVNLVSVSGVAITLGQKAMTASLPITIASDQSTLSVNSSTARGAAQPANAYYMGINGNANVLAGWNSLASNGVGGITGGSTGAVGNYIFNNSTFDIMRSAINATNSTGTGITAVGVLAQFDDVSPTSITENQFGNVRMSANRNLYGTIRDAAGNERGVNVTAGNALVVDASASTQPVSGTVAATQSGTWTVGSNSATGSAIPANVFPVGVSDGTNLVSLRQASNGLNATAGGLLAVNLAAQFDDTSPTAITENNFGNVRISADRSLLTTTQNSYSHIATATTTTVKSGAGTLRSITVNSLGTVASTTTVYDNTAGSGTVIAVINTLALSGTFDYNIQFATGLTIVTTGTAAPDLTISYK